MDYEARREEILKAVKAELDGLAAEYEPLLESAQDRAAALETEVKQATIEFGGSVKSNKLQAVYARGRISWDNKGLEGYAGDHPDILTFRKEGDPSVSLRVVK